MIPSQARNVEIPLTDTQGRNRTQLRWTGLVGPGSGSWTKVVFRAPQG